MSERVLRIKKVCEKTGTSRATVFRGVKNGTFPSPFKLGAKAVGWKESAIDAWIVNQHEAANQKHNEVN